MPEEGAASFVGRILVDSLLSPTMSSSKGPAPKQRVVILLNNLGGLPTIEMLTVTKEVMESLREKGIVVVRALCGHFMTALEMRGLSLSLLRIPSPEDGPGEGSVSFLSLIDAATTAPSWPTVCPLGDSTAADLKPQKVAYDAAAFDRGAHAAVVGGGFPCPGATAVAIAVCRRIISIEAQLTEFDSLSGDGDCGIVMKAGATRVIADLEAAALREASLCADSDSDSAAFCDSLATSIGASMGGSSGVLLEIFFRAAASCMAKQGRAAAAFGCGGGDVEERWAAALAEGHTAIAFYGGAALGMRTMLDALVPAIDALTAGRGVAAAARAAREGADSTKSMDGFAGRANYISRDRLLGVVDPGAFAVAEAFEAARDLM